MTTGVLMSQSTGSGDRTAVLPGPPPGEGPPTGRSGPPERGAAAAGVLAVAALSVGVLACAFSWMFFIRGYILTAAAVAIVLGALGVLAARRARRSPLLAAAGVALGVLAVVSVIAVEAVVKAHLGAVFGGLQEVVAAPTDPAGRTEAAPAGTASPAPTSAPTAVPPPATPDGDVADENHHRGGAQR